MKTLTRHSFYVISTHLSFYRTGIYFYLFWKKCNEYPHETLFLNVRFTWCSNYDFLHDIQFILLNFQTEKHRSLNLTRQYTLEGLYPNTLYYIWISAKSSKGEGAHTTPIKVTTEQYGKHKSNMTRGVSQKKIIK